MDWVKNLPETGNHLEDPSEPKKIFTWGNQLNLMLWRQKPPYKIDMIFEKIVPKQNPPKVKFVDPIHPSIPKRPVFAH